MINKTKKLVATIMVMMTILSSFGKVFAMEINSAEIYGKGEMEYHLQYWNDERGGWYYVICNPAFYSYNGVEYPAYCVNSDLPGVVENGNYGVTVDSMIDNVLVWRAVINGYPYKSASELGVDDNDDAYLATKQAVYCALYGWNPDRYRGGDAKGQRIADAIKRIVNEARNGSQQPSDPMVTLTPTGDMYEDGNYYVQKVDVSSEVDMASYVITATANLPEGTIITNGNGVQTDSFNGSESFYIKVPKSQMNKDISNAIINVQGKCKSYPVFYGRTTVAGTQNYALAFDPFGDGNGRTTLNIKNNNGKVVVNKTDSQTHKVIEGVEFALKNEEGTIIAKSKTNGDGVAVFDNLYQGNYKLVETETNKDYILNTDEKDVYVEYNKTANVDVTNDHKEGNVKVYKIDKDNHRVVLGNVEFQLYSAEFDKVIGTYHTDANGELEIKNLRTGDYSLIETKTNKWYNLAENTDIKVEWNLTKEIQVENELKKGQIKVIKVDKDNNEVKLKGVKFDVLDKDGKVLETIVTDENGEANTSKYAVRDFENLSIKEKETLQTYKLNTETKTIKLEENQIKNIKFENELKKAKIKVIKTDIDTNVTLKDVEFDVIDNTTKEVVDYIKTNEKGEATTKDLRIDHTYSLKETKTQEYYKLNKDTTTVDLTKYIKDYKDNIVENVNISNEKKKGQIQVIKVDKDDNKVVIEGVTFNVLDENKKVVDTLVTDKNGKATSKRLPIDQKYTLQETKTLENYVLNEEVKTVVLKEDQITNIKFENEKIKGKIKIVKTSEDDNIINGKKVGEPIADVKFAIYDKDYKLVQEIITDEKGIAISDTLLKGKYFIKEVKAGEWYLLNDKEFEAEIKVYKEVVEVDVTNKSEKPSVDVEKEGIIQTTANQEIKYDFKLKNTGNTALNNFTWTDELPTDYVRITKLITGTYNQDLRYSIYYKTNKNDYKLLKENLSTQVNNYIDFAEIELAEDEYVTEFKAEFGTVEVGFESVINPYIFVRVNSDVKNDDTFTNKTQVEGYNKTYKVWDNDDHTTKVYEKQINVKKLPRTGM